MFQAVFFIFEVAAENVGFFFCQSDGVYRQTTLWGDRLKSGDAGLRGTCVTWQQAPVHIHSLIMVRFIFFPLAVETPAVYFDHIEAPFHFQEENSSLKKNPCGPFLFDTSYLPG